MQIQRKRQRALHSSLLVRDLAFDDAAQVLTALASSPEGLSEQEATRRLARYGRNELTSARPLPWWQQLPRTLLNPFVLILVVLGLISTLTDLILPSPGARSWSKVGILATMIGLSCVLRFWQEWRSQRAVARLQALVRPHSTVQRDGVSRTIATAELVPGDLIHLAAGDLVPADVRLLTSRDLSINQSLFTGESLPIEKGAQVSQARRAREDHGSTPRRVNLLALPTMCLMGTSVVSGTARAVVVHTGQQTFLNTLGTAVLGQRPKTRFEQGINQITGVLIRFILLMAPLVFLVNGLAKGSWQQAFFFALAVAVGLTPELLPLIVSANLAKGARHLARERVLVKYLPAVQNLGAMDILCTDKTGTLTENQVSLVHYLDAWGSTRTRVLHLAALNSRHQTGLDNALDRAILALADQMHPEWCAVRPPYHKLDELPFDFVRRRMSVVVQQESERPLLICKGALEQVVEVCQGVELLDAVVPFTDIERARIEHLGKKLQDDGLRVIALATRRLSYLHTQYTLDDEQDLIFAGLLCFRDPPRATAREALAAISEQGVRVKVLTGDHEQITAHICEAVGLDPGRTLLAQEIDGMDDDELAAVVEQTVVFAQVNPLHKVRIIQSLKRHGHTVGYLGDGANDAVALREADCGISVETATEVAKASADLILLDKDLTVLGRGMREGRMVFGNIVKYLHLAASSNFGNAFSVLLASAFLPFLPMLSLQLLVQNLLYDLSQLALPWDRLDPEFLARPRQWDARNLARFMLWFGPLSSLFDLTTFAILWFIVGARTPASQALFQSGWFVEGLLSQTLIVHLLRTQHLPFVHSRASWPVLLLTGSIMLIGLVLPFTGLGSSIGLLPLPLSYFPWLLATLVAYCALTQCVKSRYLRSVRSWF